MLNVIMLKLLYWMSLCWSYYTEYHCAECHYAECHCAECHYAECHYAECHYAESHYAECHYADCHYAECYYAECHGPCFKEIRGRFVECFTLPNFMLNKIIVAKSEFVKLFLWFLKVILLNFAIFYTRKHIFFWVDKICSCVGTIPGKGGWDAGVWRSISI